ncbi:hypothetical protein EU244_028155 [Rhodococcus qingshengii]|uniref:hypothetical protein n=1 Tax=Rhodococcus qingshengii TaxID=334542 RepID=UPI0010A6954B|nr:hypothetical protein [Rhodococcus qingshengii]THJ64647.1 hypothetical protein EU244_31220 [Rhodococcus qingshengii]
MRSRSDGRYGDRAIERIERIAVHAALAESIADGATMAKELAVQNERTRLSAEISEHNADCGTPPASTRRGSQAATPTSQPRR